VAYTALARRYRSSSFDEVVGQEPIARTLRNAIDKNRVAHAYLFCGTRGVGKTTMARLFAKALNAPGDKPKEVAQAIMEGRDTDVIEIDAASNRGIDDARELIANSIYRPLRGPYKIYIVDEVHMLTREAFNALLKTMEEPPEHVKFILCTTETHKVPATIQSRCQRFDFRNIPTRAIAEHLKAVTAKEGVKADAGLLMAVARLGAGSMRDALSILDRLMASGEKSLTPTLLSELLGLADRDLVDNVLRACAAANPAEALTHADKLLTQGVSIDQALEAITLRLRDVMVLSACGAETDLVELDGEDRDSALALSSAFDAPAAIHMIALCENVQRRASASSTPRALFDALIARLALTESIADVAALIAGQPAPARAAPPPPLGSRTAPPTTSAGAREKKAPPAADGDSQPTAGEPRRPATIIAPPARSTSAASRPAVDPRDEAMQVPIVKKVADLFNAQYVRTEFDDPRNAPGRPERT